MRINRHPMVDFGRRRSWGYEETASHFGVTYGTFRQIVTGWTGASLATAQEWAKRGSGEFSTLDILLWHQSNRRRYTGGAAA